MDLLVFILGAALLVLSIFVVLASIAILSLHRKNKALQERMANYEEIVEGQELLADRVQLLIARLGDPVMKPLVCGGCNSCQGHSNK